VSATHTYEIAIRWTGNRGLGTIGYRDYDRTLEIDAGDKPTIIGSSDPTFRGDAARWNPEDLLVAGLSQCHMLSYLHLAALAGVVVTDYTDSANGTLDEVGGGSGQFRSVVLHPVVTVAEESMRERAQSLHDDAEKACFIARSVNFPVTHEPTARCE
jgi:organic hydroperoxide reductase OsmC/OhrA